MFSTLGNMMAGGRTSAWRMTCRSASARPLETEFTLTHFSVRPRSSSASILGIVSLASVCEEAEISSICMIHKSTFKGGLILNKHLGLDRTHDISQNKLAEIQHSVKDTTKKKKTIMERNISLSILLSGSLTNHMSICCNQH